MQPEGLVWSQHWSRGDAVLLLALIRVRPLATGGAAGRPAEAVVAGLLSEPAAVRLDFEGPCCGLCS